ncbi:YceD family protein [Pseudoduganella sp. RAF53_2]|uniref:YceD family protein n=1 Tax=unclassified Pseudoduganella TaxID=2637179 RepID=UPI003F9E2802
MNAFEIDAFEFCRTNSTREGVTPVAEMTRLSKDCADTSGEISWKAEGGTSKQGYPQLRLTVAGKVRLVCQRCMTPFEYEMDSSTLLMLGKDDEEADEIEAIIDDESIDVIVGTRSMNLMDLIEDEALLALPQAPKHEVCPDTSLLDKAKSAKESPFATLKGLKADQ